ncbi:S1C family serine protease [Bythopirellula polymerisocia]|uniref:Putative serine protease HtrA n=1 Tax=Bythopirellula polymerisocia TaxID=2528003 RepID=A0A5C6CU52_9BACT|nr:trypsin-like peptidase domain-containing protein [Bythopirellula polymerisocia]TWU28493.1 putative serine protease HtrA [Bythopirellula polymerisocia]
MKRYLAFGCLMGLLGLAVGTSSSEWINNLTHPSGIAYAVQPGVAAGVDSSPNWEVRPGAGNSLTPEEQTNIYVYEHANPSVVNINTRSVQIDRFFMMQRESEGSGSGAIIDKSGHILTNSHVVDGANEVEVTLASNKTYTAVLIGEDKEHDIAVLKIQAPSKELTPIVLGTSENVRVGQRVYVLGNPFGWDGTLTTGIVSSLNRDLPSRVPGRAMKSLIQTDAAMNPGNSGGPLLSTNGEMLGMCVAIATKTGQNAGVGFAIPIDRIKMIVPELIEHGHVVRADIGITHVMETESGLVVARLAPNGPAERAGLQGFRRVVQRRQQGPVIYETETVDRSHADRILAVDGEAIRTGARFLDKILEYKPGEVVYLTILRDGQQLEIPVTLVEE